MEAQFKKAIDRGVEGSGVRRRPTPPPSTTPDLGLRALAALDARDPETARRAIEERERLAARESAALLGLATPEAIDPTGPVNHVDGDAIIDFDHLVDLTATPRILRGPSPAPVLPLPLDPLTPSFVAPPKPRVSPTARRAAYVGALVLGAGLSWIAMNPNAAEGPSVEVAAQAPIAAQVPIVAPAPIIAPAIAEHDHEPEALEVPEAATEAAIEEVATAMTVESAPAPSAARTVAAPPPGERPAATVNPAVTTEVQTVAEAQNAQDAQDAQDAHEAPAAPAAAEAPPRDDAVTRDGLHVAAGDRALAVATPAEQGSILHIVDRAVGNASPEPAAPAAPAAEPEESGPSLSRDEVSTAMNAVRADVEACATGRHGQANVQMMVHPSGRVRGVRVVGTFAGTTEGSCIARAVRGARFPAFEGADFAVHFPFRL